MKRLLITLALLSPPAASLLHAQSKVTFVNDEASPVVLSPDTAGVNLFAALYAGTNSNYLARENPPVLVSGGSIPPTTITLVGTSPHYFQVKVWDSVYPSYEDALAAGAFVGVGAVFTMNIGGFLPVRTAPPSINSTWHEGPIVASMPVQAPVISNVQWINGVLQFDLYGTVGARYYVEYAESFPAASWNSLTNLVLSAPLPRTIFDTSALASDQRFYRAFGVQSQ
jgi:hypothetical protein